jgi:hypothetical protein
MEMYVCMFGRTHDVLATDLFPKKRKKYSL